MEELDEVINSDEMDHSPVILEKISKPFTYNPKIQSTPINPALKLNNIKDFKLKIPLKIKKNDKVKILEKIEIKEEIEKGKIEEEIEEIEEIEDKIEDKENKENEKNKKKEKNDNDEIDNNEIDNEEENEKQKLKKDVKVESKTKFVKKKSKEDEKKEEKKQDKKKVEKEEKKKEVKKKDKRPNYAEMSPAEQKKARKKFKHNFELLRDNWKNYNIPEIDDDTSLDELYDQYKYYIKHIHIRENSGKYKVYMVILWLAIEWLCSRLGLPISGYTMMQLKAMNRYEKYLIKLGERYYTNMVAEESNWPVEFDLLFVALINAILLIIVKLLCDYLNISNKAEYLTDTLSSYLSGGQPMMSNDNSIPEVPQNPMNQFGNLDIPNLLSTFGNMFINKNQQQNTDIKTPKYKPMYEE